MKLITQEEIGLFYQYFVLLCEEGDQILAAEERRTPDDLVYLMFSDLLDTAQRLAGVDGRVAREEVDAINELFASAGYHTGWLSLKLESSVIPPKRSASDVLTEVAEIQLAICNRRLERGEKKAIEKAYSAIETFLYAWTTFMCEILIADRDFSQEEIDLLLDYISEFCDRVTSLFGKAFPISQRIEQQLHTAMEVCYH